MPDYELTPDAEVDYVFVQIREDEVPLIVAVLHEKMDLLVRLRDRLDELSGAEE
ncbi:MAG: hypothetical protein OXC12_17465 [Spirochaetaceae bacterium]|nr:hypothetical protein [Spirochaetaceae bacterium]